MKITPTIYCLLLILLGLALAQPALAIDSILKGIGCISNGNCNPGDLLKVFVNISKIILGLSGSVALILFIVGGIFWLTSAGNTQRVDQGKKILGGTLIGLVIIFGAWLGVGFLQDTLGVAPEYTLTGGFCDRKTDGISCGDNSVCLNNSCVTECAKEKGTEGWACQAPASCGVTYKNCDSSPASCKTGLCPRGEENVCCKKNNE